MPIAFLIELLSSNFIFNQYFQLSCIYLLWYCVDAMRYKLGLKSVMGVKTDVCFVWVCLGLGICWGIVYGFRIKFWLQVLVIQCDRIFSQIMRKVFVGVKRGCTFAAAFESRSELLFETIDIVIFSWTILLNFFHKKVLGNKKSV